MNSLRDEFALMLSGKAGKYYILALVFPIIIALVFSAIFIHNQINEGGVLVIDMDNSAYSRQLIDKLNASQYIDVKTVVNDNIDIDQALYHEEYLAVIYLPKDLEANHTRALPNSIGLFLDNTNMMGTANLRTAVQEVITAENMTVAIPRVKALGVNDDQTTGIINNITVQQRLLYNPNGNYANTTVLGFLVLYPTIIYHMQVLPLMARLRMTGRFEAEIRHSSPLGVASRVLPYALFAGIGIYFGLGLLKTVGGFRYAGNAFALLIPIFLYTISQGLLAVFVAWKARHPGEAMSKMMLILIPGFLFSGATISTALLPEWAKIVGNFFPMVWLMKFIRDLGLRGAPLSALYPELGAFVILFGVMLLLVTLRFLSDKRKLLKQPGGEPTGAAPAPSIEGSH
ncbi:ABC transporter permease [Brevibacillus fulvus]|uniref:ABC-2 type transport system permease protein n=1 Tax=Brevibacillus fulvus TaxID=1125967 RepID=A0A938XWF6_9BACL|nr:ABC transporter permease [Brevibacillus fulvus]MBM7588928.1 ABC-2 type transport system permease protein [Brevibacillus fulvus]